MLVRLVDARYRGGHRVWLRFADGLAGEVDLAAEMWGEVFEPMRDPEVFRELRVDGTLVWPNGADLAPEFLYELLDAQARGESD
jgi:hypothetical protein